MRTVLAMMIAALVASCGYRSQPGPFPADECGDLKSVERDIVNGVESFDPGVVNLTDGQVKAIGAININFTGSCSGTLIAPNLVLTAAHCVESLAPDASVRFLVGTSYLPPEASFNAAEWHFHPLYAGSSSGEADPVYDIAVVIIEGDTAARGIVPIPVNLVPTSLLAQTIQSVGYGITDPGGSGWNTTRWWTTQVVRTETPAIFITSDDGASGLCQGDSGGPMLYTMDDSEVRVMAVASGIDSDDCLGNSYYARSDFARDWLAEYLPGPCGSETLEGRCDGDMAVWCDGGEVFYHACGDFGWDCGPNADGLMRCVPPCEGETFEGRCDGEVAVWCESSEVFYHDCPSFGYICGLNGSGDYRCIPPDPCEGITLGGLCEGGAAIWCEDGALLYHYCEDFGYSCGVNAAGDFRCLDECESLGFEGECTGGVARWCWLGRFLERDCAACGLECGWTGDELGYYCL